ncbi:MAG TPA: hypothetical protein VEI49_09980, partial [Terriglobales bacterium]|nr:hypothetical protein [Terriglobales bacterium]
MHFLVTRNSVTRSLAIAFALTVAIASWAQVSPQHGPSAPTAQPALQAPQPQNFQSVDYSRPRAHFPNPLAPYEPRHVSPPKLSNTPLIDQLMHDGKIMLSIDDAVALA